MAKVFLDANYFIGLANRVPQINTKILDKHKVFVSILSCHILCYVNKIDLPDKELDNFLIDFNILDLNQDIFSKALHGPTSDFEDNVQLHSAVAGECDFFLTEDRELLRLTFFGKTRLVNTLK